MSEETTSRYYTRSRKLPTSQYERQPSRRFQCPTCNRKYNTKGHLKTHIKCKHSDSSHNSHQHKRARQRRGESSHLYCFICKRFLTSQTDISRHPCKPTRLLSRHWYRKAVWSNKLQCTVCYDKVFNQRRYLEKHMYTHEKKISHLFKFLPSSSTQTEQIHVNDLVITNNTSSDISCHNGNYITIETASGVSTVDPSVNVSESQETRSCISAVSNENTFSRKPRVRKPHKRFACENCNHKSSLPDVFKVHVIMNSNCLSYYENREPTSSMIEPYCFKCKRDVESDRAFIDHHCKGVVSIMYKCALCPTIVPNMFSLKEHENHTHKESMEFKNVETIQTSTHNETVAAEASVYRCIPCRRTFHDSGRFVEHRLQVHEMKTSTARM